MTLIVPLETLFYLFIYLLDKQEYLDPACFLCAQRVYNVICIFIL